MLKAGGRLADSQDTAKYLQLDNILPLSLAEAAAEAVVVETFRKVSLLFRSLVAVLLAWEVLDAVASIIVPCGDYKEGAGCCQSLGKIT